MSGFALPAVHGSDHWLWDPEDGSGPVTVLRRGYLRLLRYSVDGRRLITGIAGPGAVIGEILPRRGRYEVECATEVSLCTFARAPFEHLAAEEGALRRAIRRERGRALDALHGHIWMRGLQTPEERLAVFLVRACEMLPFQRLPSGGGVLALVVPRADIADLIGTTRETISRLTHRWQDEGLMSIPDGTHLVIHDPDGLARRGGLGPRGSEKDLPPDAAPEPWSRDATGQTATQRRYL